MVSERIQERTAALTDLAGAEVAVTGRLASMSRDEAHARIQEVGGRVVDQPRSGTNFLVVGQGGPPLGEDGRLTNSLREAHSLLGCGTGVRRQESWVASGGRRATTC